jgi:hypothetical protein
MEEGSVLKKAAWRKAVVVWRKTVSLERQCGKEISKG